MTAVKKFTSVLTIVFCSLLGFQAHAAPAAGYNTPATSDNALTQQVETRLNQNTVTSNSNIDVTTTNGVVYLSGKLESEGEASAAVEEASSIDGVSDVDTNNLLVRNSEAPYEDAYITAKVKGAFVREKLFGDDPIAATQISVETIDGIVHLTGTADNQAQIDTAVATAQEVKGVNSVESKVTIQQ